MTKGAARETEMKKINQETEPPRGSQGGELYDDDVDPREFPPRKKTSTRETEGEETPMRVRRGDDEEGDGDMGPDEGEERKKRRLGLMEGKGSGKRWDAWREELRTEVGETVDIVEAFSPPRVTHQMEKYGLQRGGHAFVWQAGRPGAWWWPMR